VPVHSAGSLLAVTIPVGDHVQRKVAGVTLNLDTIWTTLLAGAVVLALGFYLRAKVSATSPNRVQVLWEAVVTWVGDQVEAGMGPRYRRAVPLAVTLFVLILVANWIEVFPGLFHNTDYLPAPTADVNMTYALAAVVFVVTNLESMRARGLVGYLKSFFARPRWLAPIRVIEELMKPVTLALRLFGNLFSGGIMIALILAFPLYFFPATVFLSVVWKLFDMFIGVIQAFIFALLTILYYQFAVSEEAH
jgi:F-type H+-transporting ATPase subunit a